MSMLKMLSNAKMNSHDGVIRLKGWHKKTQMVNPVKNAVNITYVCIHPYVCKQDIWISAS